MKLEELKKLCAEATPGPWKYDWGNWEVEGPRPERKTICTFPHEIPHHGSRLDASTDGEFIAAARNHMEKLIAVVETLKSLLAEEDLDVQELANFAAYFILKDQLAALESE